MYLRFRRFDRNAPPTNSAYFELYERIHGKCSPETVLEADYRIQVSLVENRRINGKPRQTHLAVIANLPKDTTETIRNRFLGLDDFNEELREKFIAQITAFDANAGNRLNLVR